MTTPATAERPSLLRLLDQVSEPTPGDVISARQHAGQSQAQAAALVGLSGAYRWSEYERGVRVPELSRWALYLLATGQHPGASATPLHRGNISAEQGPSAVEMKP